MKIFRTGAYESLHDMPIEINWMMTHRCNYRCTYCYFYGTKAGGGRHLPQYPFSTLEQLKTAVENIASLNRPWYNIVFCGGEPTIHPHLFETITLLHDSLKERINEILIITNGSRNKKFYENLKLYTPFMRIHLIISIHTDHVEMDHILELIENLSPSTHITFNLMFNPDKRDMVHSIYKTLLEYRKNYSFNMSVVLVSDFDNLDPRYTEEDLDWYRKTTPTFQDAVKTATNVKTSVKLKNCYYWHVFHDMENNGKRVFTEEGNHNLKFANGMLNFTGMYCIANASMLRIEANGDCRGMACDADPVICNIYEKDSLLKNWQQLIHAVQCPMNICGCSSNDPIPKFASFEEAKRFMEIVHLKQARLFLNAPI